MKPQMHTPCGLCKCPFSYHYVSFDGAVSGCTRDFGQRDGRCNCRGFAIIYKPVFPSSDPTPEMVRAYYEK